MPPPPVEAPLPLPALDRIDARLAEVMNRHGRRVLRWALAVIFIWFGALKPLGSSPANDLIARTIVWFPPEVFLPVLGVWEVVIGVCLLFRPLLRLGLFLLALQLPGTMLPLFLKPEVCFTHVPWGLTLEGQYIVKNLLILGAALVVGGTVRQVPDERRKL